MLPAGYTWSLTAIAAVSGVALLWIWKRFSNQERIGLAKRQMRARLYAVRLYGDEPALAFRAQAQLWRWTGRYLAGVMAPAALSLLPVLILFVTLDPIFGHRPLRIGETAMVTARLSAADTWPSEATLEGRGVVVETPGLRLPDRHQVCWRVRNIASEPLVRLHSGGTEVSKAIHCGYGPGLPNLLWAGRPSLDISCPAASLDVFGFGMDWPIWFALVSLVTMLVLRSRFHVIL